VERWEHGQVFNCPVCFRQFSSQNGLQCHLRDAHRRHGIAVDGCGKIDHTKFASGGRRYHAERWRPRQLSSYVVRNDDKANDVIEQLSTVKSRLITTGDAVDAEAKELTEGYAVKETHTFHTDYGANTTSDQSWTQL
jgi:hypothetical protein